MSTYALSARSTSRNPPVRTSAISGRRARTWRAVRQCRGSPPGASRGGDRGRAGAGGHEGGEDVVRVAVQVLAGPVVAHRGPGVGVAGGDLDIAQVNASVQTGRE